MENSGILLSSGNIYYLIKEWGHYTPDRSLDDFISSRKAYTQYTNQLPLTIVAFQADVPVGMCSLTKTRGILPELTLWLSALYVVPKYRNQGIGALLEKEIVTIALRVGYTKSTVLLQILWSFPGIKIKAGKCEKKTGCVITRLLF